MRVDEIYWFVAIRLQLITWANVDPDLGRYMVSLGHNNLTHWSLGDVAVFLIEQYPNSFQQLPSWALLAVFQITASPSARSRQLWKRTGNFFKTFLQFYVYDSRFKAAGLTTFLTEFWTLLLVKLISGECRRTPLMITQNYFLCLVPSGNKLLPEPMLTQIYVTPNGTYSFGSN